MGAEAVGSGVGSRLAVGVTSRQPAPPTAAAASAAPPPSTRRRVIRPPPDRPFTTLIGGPSRPPSIGPPFAPVNCLRARDPRPAPPDSVAAQRIRALAHS